MLENFFFFVLGVNIMVLPMISKKYTTELFLQPSFTFHFEPQSHWVVQAAPASASWVADTVDITCWYHQAAQLGDAS